MEPVDPNLKGQYIDEWLGGFEYQLKSNIVVGAKYTHRNLGRVIEDFLIPDQGRTTSSPTRARGSERRWASTTSCTRRQRRSRSASKTRSRSRARSGSANNWQFLASAVFSKLEGNYDGTFQASTGQLDPNINSAFDYADFLVNAKGS